MAFRHRSHGLRRSRAQAGFTLIELMAVVVILGILAAVAIGAYTKHVRNAHKAAVIADMSNISLKQKTFRAVQGHYATSTTLGASEGPTATYPDATTLQTTGGPVQWVVSDAGYTLDGEGDAAYLRGGGALHGFDALRFLPESAQSLCGYATVSGHGTDASDPNDADAPPGGTLVDQIFPAGTEPYYANDWFYAYALCDFDFDGTFWAFTAVHYEDAVNYTTDATGTYRENE